MKNDRQALQSNNIQLSEQTDKAMKEYTEIRDAFRKLDEGRHVLNRLMGPNGIMSNDQRANYFGVDVTKSRDGLLASIDGSVQKSANFSQNTRNGPPQLLRNNPSKSYFGAAGI